MCCWGMYPPIPLRYGNWQAVQFIYNSHWRQIVRRYMYVYYVTASTTVCLLSAGRTINQCASKAVVGGPAGPATGPAMAGPLFLPSMQTYTCNASNLAINYNQLYSSKNYLVRILLVIPATNATNKRTFSARSTYS